MARRGRGSSARAKAAPDGRDTAINGSAGHVDAPGDEPGARTIGALALKRWAARGPGRGDVGDDVGEGPPTHGPFDEDDVGEEQAATERVDFGAVQVPVPHGGEVSVEPEDGRLQAVHVMLPTGRLSVSALAAPRTERLWPDLAAEIDESLREGGATVRSFTGEWGRELHARTGDASSLFVGVDGPRWMLYGVATGPTSAARELDAALRAMLRGTVVVRGRSPYPVRTVLPLTVPEHLPLPGPVAMPERVPVPRMPAERPAAPSPGRRGPLVDAPTTVTPLPAAVDTVPHGIPRTVTAAAVPESESPDRSAYRSGPAADPAPAEPAVTGDTEAEVSRTASRGLFRRKPERPSARPPQRRVADLLAQAERDRAAVERQDDPSRLVGPAADGDDPGREVPAGAPPAPAPRAPMARGVNGSRSNGFVPRELTCDQRPSANGASHDAFTHGPSTYGPSTYDPSTYDRSGANGAAHPAPDVPVRNGTPAARPYPDLGLPGGSSGSYRDELPGSDRSGSDWSGSDWSGGDWPGSAWPASGETRSGGAEFGSWIGAASAEPDEWPYEHHRVAGSPHHDVELDAWSGSVNGSDAAPWHDISVRPDPARPFSAISADGSDDWTLPLPVVRPAPPPEPALPEAPPGRRARREAEERGATGERWAPPGAHSADRPRHGGGHHEREAAPDDRATRASHRSARTHARHAEESDDYRRRADGARHRRPEY